MFLHSGRSRIDRGKRTTTIHGDPSTFAQKIAAKFDSLWDSQRRIVAPLVILELASIKRSRKRHRQVRLAIDQRMTIAANLEATMAILKDEVQQEQSNFDAAQSSLWDMSGTISAWLQQHQADQDRIRRLTLELQGQPNLDLKQTCYYVLESQASRLEKLSNTIQQSKYFEKERSTVTKQKLATVQRGLIIAVEQTKLLETCNRDLRAELESIKENSVKAHDEHGQCQQTRIALVDMLGSKTQQLAIAQSACVDQAKQLEEAKERQNETCQSLMKAEQEITTLTQHHQVLGQRCGNLQFKLDTNFAFSSVFDDGKAELEESLKEVNLDLQAALEALHDERARETPPRVMLEMIDQMELLLAEKAEWSIYNHSDLRRAACIRSCGQTADDRWESKLMKLKAQVKIAHEGTFEFEAGHQERKEDQSKGYDRNCKEATQTYGGEAGPCQGESFEMVIR